MTSTAEKLEPLAPHPIETVMMLGSMVGIAFAFFAIWKVHRGDWRSTYAVALVLLNFLVPFAGVIVAAVRGLWLRGSGVGPTAA